MIDERLKHVGIILDGNGRWAKKNGMIRSMGHKKGSEALEKIAEYACDKGLKYLSVFGFSTDNFKRSDDEVNYIMDIIVDEFTQNYKTLIDKGIKVVFSGCKEGLRDDVVKAMEEIGQMSKDNTKATLNVCLNYGGQEEIVRAAERYSDDVQKGLVKNGEVSREDFYRYLDNDLPPLDILIRTGGEKRVSGFMLYQLAYAELFFVDEYFPAFTPEMFDNIIKEFYSRDRRYGGINDQKNNS